MCKKCWAVIVLLLALNVGMAYKFLVQGNVEQGSDGRVAIQLNAGERDFVLAEMRMFLETVQAIVANVNKGDMQAVAAAARKVGGAAQQAVPGALMGKLPVAFKKLGFDTHSKFDQLALDAEEMGDKTVIMDQLETLMQNCVGCHAAHRIDTVAEM